MSTDESTTASTLFDEDDYDRVERAARRKLIIGAAIVVLLAAGCVGGLIWKHVATRRAVDAKVGECLTGSTTYDDYSFLVVDCGDGDALYRVVATTTAPANFGLTIGDSANFPCKQYPDAYAALFLNSQSVGDGHVRVLCLEVA